MQPPPNPERRRARALAVVWPSFLMAGVLEALVFALIDPQQLHLWSGEPLAWPAQAVYTLAFFAFWVLIGLACWLALWLAEAAPGAGGE